MRFSLVLSFVTMMLVGSAACAGDAVPQADAKTLLKNLVSIAADGAPDDALRLRILLQQCAELSSCAGSCARALNTASTVDDEAMRGTVLVQCFPDFKKAHQEAHATVDSWFTKFFSAYATRARAALPAAEDQKALTQAATKLKLTLTTK